MKISPIKMIKSLYNANKPLRKAPYKERIVIKGELDGYYEKAINDMYGKIDEYVKRADLDMRLAQEGDLLLINTGSNTSFIDKKEIKNVNDIFSKIRESVDKTMNDILKSGQ